MADNQTYLGDGVYASYDGYGVWIWTSDGVRQSEKIYLEPSVLAALVAFEQRSRRDIVRRMRTEGHLSDAEWAAYSRWDPELGADPTPGGSDE